MKCNHRAALVGGVSLAVMLGGCATTTPGPSSAQFPPPVYYDDSYQPPVVPPTENAAVDLPPVAPAPAQHAPTWPHDLVTAGGGAAVGVLAGKQLASNGLRAAAGAGVGSAVLGESVAPEVGEGAAITWEMIEGVLIELGEVAVELAPLGISYHPPHAAPLRRRNL